MIILAPIGGLIVLELDCVVCVKKKKNNGVTWESFVNEISCRVLSFTTITYI